MNTTYRPTWLYIKKHNVTGLKYFGMTRQSVEKYSGSGVYWKLHLAKYGNNVTTIWCKLFEAEKELQQFAVEFSLKNNIVESTKWANLVPESGEYGKSAALPGWKHSESAKQKISSALRGKLPTPGFVGRSHTQESKEKCSNSLKGRKFNKKFVTKTWVIITPDNAELQIENLHQWCLSQGINYQSCHRNVKLNKPYKGFVIKELTNLKSPIT